MAWGYNEQGQYGWIADGSTPSGAAAEQVIASGGVGPSGGAVTPGGGGLAKQVSNPGTNGSNARYHVGPGSGMTQLPNGDWTDGVYTYDQNGLSRDRPDSVQPGLPPANESEGYDVYTGQVKSGGGGGGSSVGAGMSSSDPYFNQIKSMLMAQSAGDAASTKAMLQKMLIGFGMVPEGFEDKLGVLDDLTKSLIAKNTGSGISQYARLLEAKGDNTKALIGRLSASGLRRSGTKGAKLRKGQLDYDRLLSDSLNEVLQRISGAYGNYTSNEQSRQMQLLSALQNSQGNYWSGAGSSQQSAPSGGGGGFTPIWQGTWAQGIDTGGYVPNSGQITDYGANPQTFNLGGGVVAY